MHAGLVVFFSSLCFATSGPLAKVAAPADPSVIAAGRTAIASLILLSLAPKTTFQAVRQASARSLLGMIGAGVLLAGHFYLFTAGLTQTSLPAAVTLVSLEPVAVILVVWFWFRARPSKGEAIGILLATVGAMVVAQAAGQGEHRLSGDILVLGAVVLYGGYVAVARGLAPFFAPSAYAALVFGVSALTLFVLCVVRGATWHLPWHSWLSIVALGVVPTLGGHTMVQWAAGRTSAALVALVSPGETLGSLMIGALMLSAIPSSYEFLGAGIVLSGVFCTWFSQQAASHGSKLKKPLFLENSSMKSLILGY
jgi:drug/metabolite transporter (DMT)-like permease